MSNSSDSVVSSSSSATDNQRRKEPIEPLISQVFGHLKSAASTVNQLTSNTTTLSESQQHLMKQSIDDIYATMTEMRQKHGSSSDTNFPVSDIDDLEMDMESLTDKYLENVDRFLLEHQELSGNDSNEPQFVKPQTKWTEKPDNSNTLFKPKLQEKPNALVPLDEIMSKPQPLDSGVEHFPYTRSGFGLGGDVRRDSHPHPYLPEIQQFQYREDQLKPCNPQMFKSLDAVPCTWVDNKEKLLKLSAVLDGASEFAIDLEHHSYRTYQGFSCLMQISTREEDFLVDTVELREELQVLNSSFTNPKIVKIMHGADCDILWLQRDFGLYLVNMFDTGQAARVIGISPAYGFLLPHYCKVEPDKKYQLADWRLRPLPSVMITYARADTHFLLYIYDRLRNDVYDQKNGKEGLRTVLDNSRKICMRRYEKFITEESSYMYLRRKFPQGITEEEDAILKEMFKWRDSMAREHDESSRFVLPDDSLMFVVRKKPQTVHKLQSMCSPCSKILKDNANHVVNIIKGLASEGMESAGDDEMVDTPSRDATVSKTTGRDSPLLDLSQLCQQAHWFTKPEMIQSVSFDNQDQDAMVDTPRRSHSHNVHVPQSNQSSFFSDSAPHAKNEWNPSTPSRDLMELYSPSGYSKPQPEHLPQQEEDAKFLDKHHFETPISTPPPSKNDDEHTPPEERVPKSLREIYRLSQQNRKKNKHKKKLKQSSVTDPRPAYSPASVGKSKKHEMEDPKDFMDQIGWKAATDSPIAPVQQAKPNQHGKRYNHHKKHKKRGGRRQ